MRECPVLAAVRTSLALLALAVVGPAWCPAVALSATKHATGLNEAPFSYNTTGVVGIGADPASVDGPAVLQFQGLSGASYDPAYGQPISLGQFVPTPGTVAPGTTTYSGTPFEVEIHAAALDKTSKIPLLDQIFPGLGKDLSLKTLNENSLLLKGHLDGTVVNGQADVTATVDTVKLGSLDAPTKDHITHYTFPIRFSQLKLPSSWVMAGATVPTAAALGLNTPAPGSGTVTTASTTTAARPMIAEPQLIAGTAPSPAPAPLAQMSAVGNPTPTPEPSTILLFAAAFGGLALARRRARAAGRA